MRPKQQNQKKRGGERPNLMDLGVWGKMTGPDKKSEKTDRWGGFMKKNNELEAMPGDRKKGAKSQGCLHGE